MGKTSEKDINTAKQNRMHTASLTALHLLVDGICACSIVMVTANADAITIIAIFSLYNIIAFASQPLTGLWMDKTIHHRMPFLSAIVSLLCGSALSMLAGTWESMALYVSTAILLGIGNSLFHVYGGNVVAKAWHNDPRPLGVFVSTGAVGLTLGLCIHSTIMLLSFWAATAIVAWFHAHNANYSEFLHTACKHNKEGKVQENIPLAFLLCLMIVVAGRSFIGKITPPIVPSSIVMIVLASVIAMAGKAAGGFLAALIGIRKALIGSLMAACVALLLCPFHIAVIPVTVFLANLSMPCTLHLAVSAMPGRTALAFGMLAAALLQGYWLGGMCMSLPAFWSLLNPLLATIIIESLMLLYMREKAWQVLTACVLMNILTNVPLNIFISASSVSWLSL